MVKVEYIPMDVIVPLPQSKEMWAIPFKEAKQLRKSIIEICNEKFNQDPVFIYEDISMRAYYIGVN